MAKPFPAWLQDQLDERDWKQVDLARASNDVIKAQTVSKWLNGKGLPPELPSIEALASAFRISIETVVYAVRERDPPNSVTQIIAQSVPDTIQPHEARLIAHLLRSLVAGIQEWNKEEDDRDEALLGEQPESNVVSVRAVQRKLEGVDPEKAPQ